MPLVIFSIGKGESGRPATGHEKVCVMKFVKMERADRVLKLALRSKKNVLLWGPAGHGKSEFVQNFLEKGGKEGGVFTQSFGEGMSEDRLYGGLNFKKFEEEGILEYNVGRSFLSYDYVVFEELFDAPPVVLLSLKDTIQARKLRNGAQAVEMAAKVIIGITNRDPKEISEMGAAFHALIERFPLQLKVEWDSYRSGDYLELFEAVIPNAKEEFSTLLAGMAEEVAKKNSPISPRSAIHALQAMEKGGVEALEFIPGLEKMAVEAWDRLYAAKEKRRCSREISDLLYILEEEEEKFGEGDSLEILQAVKACKEVYGLLEELSVPDSLTGTYKEIKQRTLAAIEKGQRLALERI